ncbi:hypothetical protein BO82DRAFT_286451 [Aspergillus uvarum CBS 121591]|uniref:Methyltransferase domain-containing protein n=1 Tax=Aspergillus uvarum CBS 121591 TaxID=1448315 RepID=A0A319C5G2_9EURO|nr:hypothetical protein BO82DRAFT_286451 [Aspergillus uvarum CBS 121591]PYH80495.1 hypothetical protein BO82DRAFT_286451 [Aspergillus uvarum CBS 121591]
MFWFLHFDLAKSPIYQEILSNVQDGTLLLDLGCGLGQDIRRLVYDGAPQDNIIGLDLHRGFIDLGFELFNDRNTLRSAFVVQDFFERSQIPQSQASRIRIINSGYFMHLWDWDGQIKVAKHMISLLSLEEDGIVTGMHFGSKQTGVWEKVPADNDPIFLHDPVSFKSLWQQVGSETETKLDVWSSIEQDEDHMRLDPNGLRLRWYVRVFRH